MKSKVMQSKRRELETLRLWSQWRARVGFSAVGRSEDARGDHLLASKELYCVPTLCLLCALCVPTVCPLCALCVCLLCTFYLELGLG